LPRVRAIWLADRPSVQRDFNCSTRSSVQLIPNLLRDRPDIVSVSQNFTRPVGETQNLVHRMRFGRCMADRRVSCLTTGQLKDDKTRPRWPPNPRKNWSRSL
jgi:hypothetical protein